MTLPLPACNFSFFQLELVVASSLPAVEGCLSSRNNSKVSDFLPILTAFMTQKVKIIAAENVLVSHIS